MAGEILKKKREESGQNLKEIAHALKIRYDYLKAIEDEDFKKLPAPVYTKGYIREYARFLKINPDVVIKAYLDAISPPVPEKSAPQPETPTRKNIPAKYLLPAGIILSLAVYAIYTLGPWKSKTPPPEPLMQKIQPDSSTRESNASQQLPEKTADTETGAAIQPQQEQQAKEHILEIYATDTTWLFANIDNVDSIEMLLKQGESAKLSAKQHFSLKIGNAGGIKLIFDGKEIKTQGEKGQVINLNLPADTSAAPYYLQ